FSAHGGGSIDSIVENAVAKGWLPGNDNAIYVVATAPGVLSSVAGAAGFNFKGDYPSIWVSTASIPATKTNPNPPPINADNLSNIFSHELVEIMTDPDNDGYEVNPGATWTNGGSGNQIGDYEGNSYTFRE